jgi:amino acid permease
VPAPGGDDAAKAGYAATVLSLVNVIMGAGAVSIPFAVK